TSVTVTATASVGAAPLSIPLSAPVCDFGQSSCSASNFPAVGGSSTLTVVKGGAWTLSSDSAWVHIPQPSFTDNQTGIPYPVAANNGTARNANISLNGVQTFVVSQQAPSAGSLTVSLTSSRNPIGPGETAQFTVSAGLPANTTAVWSASAGSIVSTGA